VCNTLIDWCNVFEFGNEWANVLEGCSSNDLRRWVLQELKVQVLKLLGLLLERADLGDIGDDISAGFAHFLIFVPRQFLIQGEDLRAEAVESHILGHVEQVLHDSNPYCAIFIHAE
jgi:hypothetical protein